MSATVASEPNSSGNLRDSLPDASHDVVSAYYLNLLRSMKLPENYFDVSGASSCLGQSLLHYFKKSVRLEAMSRRVNLCLFLRSAELAKICVICFW